MVPVAPVSTVISLVITPHIGCILRSFRLTSSSHLCLFKLECLFKEDMVIFHYHRLCCRVSCQGIFCQFSFTETIIELAYIRGLFLVTLLKSHTSNPCLILPYIPPYVKE